MREVRGEYERCGVRVITYDRPGYGRSTRLEGRSIADAAGDVVAIADHLGLDQFGVIGVSGGGPHALAVAAKAPDRVTRCATIVSGAPYDADGLDYFADMPDEERRAYDRLVAGGEEAALADVPKVEAFRDSLLEGTSDIRAPEPLMTMFAETVKEALAQGPYGVVDDELAFARNWGFSLRDVAAPTRLMLARDDAVPASHGAWLVAQMRSAEVIWVVGDHVATGPERDAAEERLLAWVAGNAEVSSETPTNGTTGVTSSSRDAHI